MAEKTERNEFARRIQALMREGHTCLVQEDYEKARRSFLKLLESREYLKNSVLLEYVLIALETTWIFAEQYDEEIMFFSEYLNRHPSDLTAYCARGAGFWYSGQLQRAINDYSRVIEVNPNHVSALSGRGQVLAEAGDFARALEDLDHVLQVIKEEPQLDPFWTQLHKQIEPFAHRGRGVALVGLGERAAALDEFNLSLTQCPENAWAYYSRAEFYTISGDPEKASRDYQRALEKKGPKLDPLRRDRAQAWLQNL